LLCAFDSLKEADLESLLPPIHVVNVSAAVFAEVTDAFLFPAL
jgi:hypothetical protein